MFSVSELTHVRGSGCLFVIWRERKGCSAFDYGAVGREVQLGVMPLNRVVLFGEGACGAGGC